MTRADRPEKKGWRKFFRFNRWIFWLNIILVLVLIFSILCKYINPVTFWPAAIMTLGFPLIYIVNLLFFLYWLVQVKRVIIIPVIGMLAGLNTALGYIQFNSSAKDTSDGVGIMSYNVRVFDYYNWKGNKNGRDRIIDLMKTENCGIYCLQEIYLDDDGTFLKEDSLVKALNVKNAHIKITKSLKQVDHMGYWGIGTFSKYPIIHKGQIEFANKGNNICIYSDIVIDGDTVRIYNMHLQSVHMGKEDYKFLQALADDKETEEIIGSKKILRRLKRAYTRRGPQADSISVHIKKSPYPVIVCGDFNDPPSSYVYRRLGEDLKDCFREKGTGFGKTYNGIFPAYRIDYIMHGEEFECLEFETLPEEYSDHNAVRAVLRERDSTN